MLEVAVQRLDKVVIVIGYENIGLADRHRSRKPSVVKGLMHVSVLAIHKRFTILADFGIGRVKVHKCIKGSVANHVVGISMVNIPIAYVSTIVFKVGYVTHREVGL